MPTRDAVVCTHFPVFYMQRAFLLILDTLPLSATPCTPTAGSCCGFCLLRDFLSLNKFPLILCHGPGLCWPADRNCRWIYVIRTAFSSLRSLSTLAMVALGGTYGWAGHLLCCHNAWAVHAANKKTNWLGKFPAHTAQRHQMGQPADPNKSQILVFPPKATLLSHAGHTFCTMFPWGLQWWVSQLHREERNLMNGSFLVHSALLTHKFHRKQGKWSITY